MVTKMFLIGRLNMSGFLRKIIQEDGNCKLGDCKPDRCKKYPYTDQSERLSSLLSILDTIEICPVAFEISERLKEEYGFRVRR